jgi:hypothetical protein
MSEDQSSPIRVTDGVVAFRVPSTVRHPWHCYNTRTGEFIECRTDEKVAAYIPIPDVLHGGEIG